MTFAKESVDAAFSAAMMAKPGVVLGRAGGLGSRLSEHASLSHSLPDDRPVATQQKPGKPTREKNPNRQADEVETRRAAPVFKFEQEICGMERQKLAARLDKARIGQEMAIVKAKADLERADDDPRTRIKSIADHRAAHDDQERAEPAQRRKQRDEPETDLRRFEMADPSRLPSLRAIAFNCYPKVLFATIFFAVLLSASVRAAERWSYPSPEVPWGPDQYTQFQNAYYHEHLALPHRRAAGPRKLFERLVDWRNIEHIAPNGAGKHEHEHSLRIILSATGAIRADYNISVLVGEPLQQELTEIQIFDLKLSGVVTQLVNPQLAQTVDATAMKTRLQGVVHSLTEHDIYNERQIAQLSIAAAQQFKTFNLLFSASDRSKLYAQVFAVERTATSTKAQMALRQLLAAISSE